MKKLTISLLFVILLIGMTATVFAASTNAQANSIQERLRENIQERQELREKVRENIRETLQNGEELTTTQKGLILKRIDSEIMEFREQESRIKTRLNINNEGNASELRARLSNGRNAQIKIMPDTAFETALARLRLKVCNESRNCTIELKEAGEGNRTRAVYEARARKTFRLFGFIKNREEVRTIIDAETGEEIEVKRPWWAWMASEADEADEIEE